METLERKYAWMKALSDTANGNLSGKDKIMLETYIRPLTSTGFCGGPISAC